MRVITLLASAAFAASASHSSYAEVEKVATVCQNGICPHWWPKVTVPLGWQHDRDHSLHYNFNALAPERNTFADSETVMYDNAIYKPRVPESKSLKEFVVNDHSGVLKEAPELSIKPDESIKTGDGNAAGTWLLEPETGGQWERVAYFEEGDYYMVFVISSRTPTGLKGNMRAFEALVRSYRE